MKPVIKYFMYKYIYVYVHINVQKYKNKFQFYLTSDVTIFSKWYFVHYKVS